MPNRQQSDPTDSQVLASRSGFTNVFGKLTAEIPKIKVPEETHMLLEQASRQAGMSLSEFCRDVLMVRVHGVDELARLHADRLRVVAGLGAERGES